MSLQEVPNLRRSNLALERDRASSSAEHRTTGGATADICELPMAIRFGTAQERGLKKRFAIATVATTANIDTVMLAAS